MTSHVPRPLRKVYRPTRSSSSAFYPPAFIVADFNLREIVVMTLA